MIPPGRQNIWISETYSSQKDMYQKCNEMKTPIVDVNLQNFIVRKQCCNCTEGEKEREREREREDTSVN
jgi:hypothetical protein